jgi:hypothetical protein
MMKTPVVYLASCVHNILCQKCGERYFEVGVDEKKLCKICLATILSDQHKPMYRYLNGQPLKDEHNGKTLEIDHTVTTFLVSIRHMGNLSEATVKDLIEKRHEVVGISVHNQNFFVSRVHND